MKIHSLQIQGYKNLKDKTKASFDFSKCTNYVALIGLNGSGKSNVLEAISIIFSNLYQKTSTPFQYEIVYELNGDIIKVENDVMTVKKRIKRENHFQYLPSNVITSYSGEELRMWEEIYFSSYSAFFRDIKSSTESAPEMLYINKYVWDYALIALLSSDKPQVKSFIKEVLKIDPDKVTISFNFKDDNIKTYPKNKAILFIEELIKLQLDSNGKLVLNQINSINPDALDNKALVRRLFYNLFIAGMPVKNEKAKIYTEKIILKSNVSFNGIDVAKLSEGEKKLILINCILHLLADEQTLILLDEPDSHIHIERKKEIIEIINQPNHFTIFTTHSPKILHSIKDENVRIIKTNETKGLEAIYLAKMEALENLTNGEFTIMSATIAISSKKPLLLVEGKGDVTYIKTAINALTQKGELDIDILPYGGAGNVKEFIDELIKCLPYDKKVIILFDRDEAGLGSEKGGMKSCIKFTGGRTDNRTYVKDNLILLMLPKTDAHIETDFLIEDYFSIDKKNEVAKNYIESVSGTFKSFPKDLRQIIKDELAKHLESYTKEDLKGFRVLIEKLKSIIDGTEVLHKEEVTTKISKQKKDLKLKNE
ncbi:ATP-dependent nuclease [Flavobacterium urocaniciphilum]|uniref:Predicted ATP-dependent endonuclease of the OLD family, contains P-loop ATPase and TOPRIM domains n=1 Tax=Flavobacterium urocaniciphilum TaxID=1299341 RepID=A0A1H9CRG7_9FLAO|nr:AAA family ATPase [Flavobacterium urocaniciphilum]SEQ03775.1 Predicted ATP-dependent endonuclease of the OLD family, contains P-loop ATPase and TOPRIM domains [Flavobacterium urocaniciphilum]